MKFIVKAFDLNGQEIEFKNSHWGKKRSNF